MNHEIESRLREKADRHEVWSLQSEIRDLKGQIGQMQTEIGRLQSVNSGRYSAISQLLLIIAENPSFDERSNELHQLRTELY